MLCLQEYLTTGKGSNHLCTFPSFQIQGKVINRTSINSAIASSVCVPVENDTHAWAMGFNWYLTITTLYTLELKFDVDESMGLVDLLTLYKEGYT